MRLAIGAMLIMMLSGMTACSSLVTAPTATLPPTSSLNWTSAPASTSTYTPSLTHTPTSSPTGIPTKTQPPPTRTPLPATEIPAPADLLPLPVGTPDSDWNGIPVMPGATAGEGASLGYLFSIEASPSEVQAYYEAEMASLGWDLLGTGSGADDTLLMIFVKNGTTSSISILPQRDGLVLVLLVQS